MTTEKSKSKYVDNDRNHSLKSPRSSGFKPVQLTDELVQKALSLLSLIDKIEIIDNAIHIETSKDLIFKNKGNTITINDGLNIIKADKIHLNPLDNPLEMIKEFSKLQKPKKLKNLNDDKL